MSSNQIAISIVMPAYNEENRLPDTLNNFSVWVANNSYMDIELIIVNDAGHSMSEKGISIELIKAVKGIENL